MFPMPPLDFVTIVRARLSLRIFWFRLHGSISKGCVDFVRDPYSIQIARVCNLDTDLGKLFEPATITVEFTRHFEAYLSQRLMFFGGGDANLVYVQK